MSIHHYRAIFLDLDNTLFSFDNMYERVSKAAISHVFGFEALGTSFEEFYRTFRATADQLYFEYEKGKRTMDSYRDERWLRTFEHFQIPITEPLMGQLNEYIVTQYLDYVEPFEGARPFLEGLKGKIPLGLITNGPVEMQTAKLQKMDFMHYFDPKLVIVSEALGVSKPEPEIFHTALQRAGIRPVEALHIGDSVKHDIVGANNIGMHSALIHTKAANGEVIPTFQFDDFAHATKQIFLS